MSSHPCDLSHLCPPSKRLQKLSRRWYAAMIAREECELDKPFYVMPSQDVGKL